MLQMVSVLAAVLLLVTAFCVKPRRLHLFEIFAIWLTVLVINCPSYSFFLVNKKWISVPESREMAVVRIVYTEILSPLFIAWSLEWLLLRKRLLVRIAGFAAMIAAFLLGGLWLDRWGVVHFYPPGWRFYAFFKAGLILLAISSAGLIRYLMRKDGAWHDTFSRN